MTVQIFHPNAELIIPTLIPTNEENVKIVTHPLMAEIKTKKCSK